MTTEPVAVVAGNGLQLLNGGIIGDVYTGNAGQYNTGVIIIFVS